MEQDPRQSASAQNPADLRPRTEGSAVRTSLQAGLTKPCPPHPGSNVGLGLARS